MWPLPMDDEYREMIRAASPTSRMLVVEKGAGATAGAMFLKEFTGDTPWVHLDIAARHGSMTRSPGWRRGATGVAVRTLVDFATKFKLAEALACALLRRETKNHSLKPCATVPYIFSG